MVRGMRTPSPRKRYRRVLVGPRTGVGVTSCNRTRVRCLLFSFRAYPCLRTLGSDSVEVPSLHGVYYHYSHWYHYSDNYSMRNSLGGM